MTLLPPGGPMEVVFTLDTTGSMSQALDEVKGRVSDMMQRLLADIPGIRMAAIAHGDYCDEHVFYLTQTQNLTSCLPEMVNFVQGIEGTGGGDTAECYELVLKMVREDMDWTVGSQRILVVIGDSYPHPPDDPQNKNNIDWTEQVALLGNMGVKIYGVQVFNDDESSSFFTKMAEATGGQHLKLTQFGHLCDVIMTICYRERGAEFLENFAAEVKERSQEASAHKDLAGVFDVLRRGNASANDVEMADSDANPVTSDAQSIDAEAGPSTPDSENGTALIIPKMTTSASSISLKVTDALTPLPPSPIPSCSGSKGKADEEAAEKRKARLQRKRKYPSGPQDLNGWYWRTCLCGNSLLDGSSQRLKKTPACYVKLMKKQKEREARWSNPHPRQLVAKRKRPGKKLLREKVPDSNFQF